MEAEMQTSYVRSYRYRHITHLVILTGQNCGLCIHLLTRGFMTGTLRQNPDRMSGSINLRNHVLLFISKIPGAD